jgi:hypothetical protein
MASPVPAQHIAQPPKPFLRKARAFGQDSNATTAICVSPSANKSDLCELKMPGPSDSCRRPQNIICRAQYNRFIGEMVRKEAQPYSENDVCVDFDRYDELFLQFSVNNE